MTTQTYNADQLNSVAKSYEQEICKLLAIKADKDLTILNLKTELAKKDKLIAELESKIKELKPD